MPTLLTRAAPQRAVKVSGPEDSALAPLWHLAVAKFRARTDREPVTSAEWRDVTRDYHALTVKERGRLSAILRERCAEQPGGT
jgi:hypothetical protein